MDAHQEIKKTDDGSPVIANVVKEFFAQFAQQVRILDFLTL